MLTYLVFFFLFIGANNLPNAQTKLNFDIASANCRSLNSSGPLINTIAKIDWLLNQKKEIYLLSEIKLTNKTRAIEIESYLACNRHGNFDFFYNSSTGSRGVAIIINRNIDYQVRQRVDDPWENYLLLDLLIDNEPLVIGSVYGPCSNQQNFLNGLEKDLTKLGSNHYLGGDWNLTPSCLPPKNNPDLENHGGNFLRASRSFVDFCNKLNLTETFRFKNPNTREFSYRVRCKQGLTKSRIDFHCISSLNASLIAESFYIPSPSKLFDHYLAVTSFKTKKYPTYRNFISNEVASSREARRIAHLAMINLIHTNSIEKSDMFNDFATRVHTLNSSIISLQRYLMHNDDLLMSTILSNNIDDFFVLCESFDLT